MLNYQRVMVVDSKIAQSLISLKMATACSAVAKAFQQDTAARYHSSQREKLLGF